MTIKKINQFPDGSGNFTADDMLLFMDNPGVSGITKYISIANSKLVRSDNSGITGASGINNIVVMNSGDYNNITPNPNTLYFIV
jgi:hypothetical protein